jgi:hypothetical protein
LKFVKSDIAKYINIWELEPHIVSLGSQKNFIHYTKKINDLVSKNKLPGDNYYRKLLANAILFKTADKLFGRKNIDAIGDTNLKSFSVAYTVSFLHYLTKNRIDLWKIYEEQKTDEILNSCLKRLLIFVYKHLVSEANNSLISEYAKRESSWKKLKETQYSENLVDAVKDYLISEEEKEEREKEKEIDTNSAENNVFLISEIQKMGLKFWDGFRLFVDKNNMTDFNWELAFDLVKKIKEHKNLSAREISFGKKVLDYIQSNPALVEEIKTLSKLEDNNVIEVKFLYDKLLLISKDDWKRIIDLASQTNIFSHLELANVKSIQNALIKKDMVKEQSLIKAFDSLNKLKKFGIKI